MSNICERCGGLKTVYITTTVIYEGQADPPLPAPTTPFSLCMCPPRREKHDGKLDTWGEAVIYLEKDDVFIRQDFAGEVTVVNLMPKQALSLLAWLKQEQDILEQLLTKV